MSNLQTETELSIRREELLSVGQPVLVAVSGGVDSMVLLHVLRRLSATYRWKLTAAHFNHRLRGRPGNQDERLVAEYCQTSGISFCRSEGDVRAHAADRGLSIEMAARDLRHAFLSELALDRSIATIATAHHADDQVELFLLRLLRGGGAGLAGMKWKGPSPGDPRIQIVRPFLDQTKDRLRDYARRHQVPFREDASNRASAILRNRVRNRILPWMCRIEPAFKVAILRSMEIIGAESELSRLMARRWLEGKRRPGFNSLHPAVQRQVVQAQLLQLGIRPAFPLIEDLRLAADRVVTVGPDCEVSRDTHGQVRVRSKAAIRFNRSRRRIRVGARKGTAEFGGLTLSWCVDPVLPRNVRTPAGLKDREWFDADKVGGAVVLRHWQAGDRFQPIGMSHSSKLQDLLTNRKISCDERHRLVLATTSQGEVFWVEGLRIGERFKLDGATRRRLEWRWSRQAARD